MTELFNGKTVIKTEIVSAAEWRFYFADETAVVVRLETTDAEDCAWGMHAQELATRPCDWTAEEILAQEG